MKNLLESIKELNVFQELPDAFWKITPSDINAFWKITPSDINMPKSLMTEPELMSGFYAFGNLGSRIILILNADGWNYHTSVYGSAKNKNEVAISGGTAIQMAGSSKYARSTDFITWHIEDFPEQYAINGVASLSSDASAEVGFVAVGNGGTILTSYDTNTWTEQYKPTPNDLRKITKIGDSLIAIGDGGTIIRTSDGYNWTHIGIPDFDANLETISVFEKLGMYFISTSRPNEMLMGEIASNKIEVVSMQAPIKVLVCEDAFLFLTEKGDANNGSSIKID